MKNYRLIMNVYLGKHAGGKGHGLLLEIILGCRSNQERTAWKLTRLTSTFHHLHDSASRIARLFSCYRSPDILLWVSRMAHRYNGPLLKRLKPKFVEITFRNPAHTLEKTQWISKSTVYWGVTPCSPVVVQQRFEGTFWLHIQGQRVSQAGSKQQSMYLCNNDQPVNVS
jgi:hypothetical protein